MPEPPLQRPEAGASEAIDAPIRRLLDIEVTRPHPKVAVLRVTGEVDALSAPPFGERVRTEHAANDRTVVIDLSQVSFLGSAGLAVLAEGAKLAHDQGRTLRVVATTHAVRRPLQVTGMEKVLVVHEDLAQAIAACE